MPLRSARRRASRPRGPRPRAPGRLRYLRSSRASSDEHPPRVEKALCGAHVTGWAFVRRGPPGPPPGVRPGIGTPGCGPGPSGTCRIMAPPLRAPERVELLQHRPLLGLPLPSLFPPRIRELDQLLGHPVHPGAFLRLESFLEDPPPSKCNDEVSGRTRLAAVVSGIGPGPPDLACRVSPTLAGGSDVVVDRSEDPGNDPQAALEAAGHGGAATGGGQEPTEARLPPMAGAGRELYGP